MGLNSRAAEIAMEMRERADELDIRVLKLRGGAIVLDCGVEAAGSIEAGRLFSSVCLGGLADVKVSEERYGTLKLPSVNVRTSEPRLACIGSQKAGWRIKVGGFFALGSGPARLLLDNQKQEFKESSTVAVLGLECSTLPDEKVSRYVAGKCGIKVENLTLLAARTASIVGSAQVSARMVETALFKMEHLGMKTAVARATGMAPIAPIVGDDNRMMGVANDMIIYGSRVHLEIEGDVDVKAMPSESSPEYGVPFIEIYKRAGYDFYKIDQGIFAPAEVSVKNIRTGVVKSAGKIDLEMLEKTLSVE